MELLTNMGHLTRILRRNFKLIDIRTFCEILATLIIQSTVICISGYLLYSGYVLMRYGNSVDTTKTGMSLIHQAAFKNSTDTVFRIENDLSTIKKTMIYFF